MNDITELILEEHAEMRRQFAALDDARTVEEQRRVWASLAQLLDLHAATEEAVFYPALLRRGADAVEETDDAIRDHNSIRDAVAAAAAAELGSERWWSAVGDARRENSEHMTEEEDGALPDFRRSAPVELRADLATRFLAFRAEHPGGRGADTADKDPQQYIDDHR